VSVKQMSSRSIAAPPRAKGASCQIVGLWMLQSRPRSIWKEIFFWVFFWENGAKLNILQGGDEKGWQGEGEAVLSNIHFSEDESFSKVLTSVQHPPPWKGVAYSKVKNLSESHSIYVTFHCPSG
jgi:hypothetical protein